MGRGRGKGNKQPFAADLGDFANIEDDKLPARRRGRPQKLLKDKIGEEGKIVILGDADDVDDGLEGTKSLALSKSSKNHQPATENGRKRSRLLQVKENENSVNAQNGSGTIIKTNENEPINLLVGYRPNGSRRKNNKPRRAAEVGFDF